MGLTKFLDKLTQSKGTPKNETSQEQDQQRDQPRSTPTESPSLGVSQEEPKPVEQHPKKLQRPPPQYHNGPYMYPGPNQGSMYPQQYPGPPAMNGWGGQHPPQGPPQFQHPIAPFPPQPGYMGPPQQYAGPPFLRAEPPTETLKSLRKWPKRPTMVPPYGAPCWLPNQPALDSMDSRVNKTVPMYEMPPPDLMDYDMSWMLSVRMLTEWNKRMEDIHWEEVRRMRNAAVRREINGDKDECIIIIPSSGIYLSSAMPPSKKRKIASHSEAVPETPNEAMPLETQKVQQEDGQEPRLDDSHAENIENTSAPALDKDAERMERFKSLQARAKTSAQRNLKEAAAEAQRQATDPNILSSLSRKQAIASHKLLKADTEAEGEDFERKRAWDWTIEESEKWDKRMAKKEQHREDVAFQDYRQDARKIYKRQLREMKPDMEEYEREKAAAVQKAAMNGGLEIVETENGELAAVDKNGTFYSTADSTDFIENKPQRTAVDRLVNDIKKAEEVRLRKRKERGRGDEEGDVTYINDKNKQFNQKLARFYNKYTAEIRDSFERGTMI
ncbi:MAG: hypothetical protein LQ350_006597 [Teloschistes chrysophthalmus]|nr:MAG: hypothetical protein LQ350_006597 [Niorma chrysophthalma]